MISFDMDAVKVLYYLYFCLQINLRKIMTNKVKVLTLSCFLTIFIYIATGNAHEKYKPISRDSISSPAAENNEGFQAFRLWVQKNYKLPKAAKKARVYGKVNVSFVVCEDGRLDDFEILEDIGYGTGEELIRVLRQARKWSPGIQDGKPVRVKYTLPMFIDTRRR